MKFHGIIDLAIVFLHGNMAKFTELYSAGMGYFFLFLKGIHKAAFLQYRLFLSWETTFVYLLR